MDKTKQLIQDLFQTTWKFHIEEKNPLGKDSSGSCLYIHTNPEGQTTRCAIGCYLTPEDCTALENAIAEKPTDYVIDGTGLEGLCNIDEAKWEWITDQYNLSSKARSFFTACKTNEKIKSFATKLQFRHDGSKNLEEYGSNLIELAEEYDLKIPQQT